MKTTTNTTIRMFGALHTFRKEQGLEPNVDVAIPSEGCKAKALAFDLGLPMDRVEAVFVNHVAHCLNCVILPGDRVAFVPTGIPSADRLMLGIYSAGKRTPFSSDGTIADYEGAGCNFRNSPCPIFSY